jgi:cytochrome c oxidase subunit 3
MHDAAHDTHRAAHFSSLERQEHAARLGMWLFLGTEVILFAGLFVSYGYYHSVFAPTFERASRHLDVVIGTVNTVVLITSSLSVAMSIHFAHEGRRRMTVAALLFSIAFGLAFLALKSVEYAHKFHEGALPGPYYRFEELRAPGASLFYTLYFLMTGLHAIHVIIGMAVLGWLAWKAGRGDFDGAWNTPLELGGMYWHLVDIIWIFLYPLLYLI